ncbi:LysE family translocator [Acinetobacter rathckeae]|uniref:LysE family translocator n=1 Tax=Acinetobacter rathckeae TaxID=2605272 RepID=UPI0018A25495|nr:LysE family translocator [Acinetobacter rathckeae]MBF7688358.1 LysE family translocator [Acinetobacter rathckeae]
MLDINWLLYCSYLATICAIIITPGPNSLLMVQHSIAYGKKASLFNALGSATAALLLMLISSIGLQIILTPHLLQFLSIIGAIYLIYLGISTIKHSKNFTAHALLQPSQVTGFKFFKDAFFVGISNPKDILFFLLFMPQFLDNTISFTVASSLLIIGWVVCDLLIMSLYALLAGKIQKLSQHNLQRISHISGGIITLIGTSILIKMII